VNEVKYPLPKKNEPKIEPKIEKIEEEDEDEDESEDEDPKINQKPVLKSKSSEPKPFIPYSLDSDSDEDEDEDEDEGVEDHGDLFNVDFRMVKTVLPIITEDESWRDWFIKLLSRFFGNKHLPEGVTRFEAKEYRPRFSIFRWNFTVGSDRVINMDLTSSLGYNSQTPLPVYITIANKVMSTNTIANIKFVSITGEPLKTAITRVASVITEMNYGKKKKPMYARLMAQPQYVMNTIMYIMNELFEKDIRINLAQPKNVNLIVGTVVKREAYQQHENFLRRVALVPHQSIDNPMSCTQPNAKLLPKQYGMESSKSSLEKSSLKKKPYALAYQPSRSFLSIFGRSSGTGATTQV